MSSFVRQAENAYDRYLASDMDTLYKAYGRISAKKQQAWEDCLVLCREYGGTDLKVITYNTYVFTAGFVYTDEEGDRMFMYITPSGHISVGV